MVSSSLIAVSCSPNTSQNKYFVEVAQSLRTHTGVSETHVGMYSIALNINTDMPVSAVLPACACITFNQRVPTCSGQDFVFVVWLALLVVCSLHIQDGG